MIKKLKSEKGITGIDIVVALVIIFMFSTIIASVIYDINSTSKEVELKSEAVYIAIQEIEKVKNAGFERYDNLNITSTVDREGNLLKNQPTNVEGYYKTIIVQDYTDIPGNEGKTENLVKKITVQISYMYKSKNRMVEISTILANN